MILIPSVEESKGQRGVWLLLGHRERNMKLALVCGLGGRTARARGESH